MGFRVSPDRDNSGDNCRRRRAASPGGAVRWMGGTVPRLRGLVDSVSVDLERQQRIDGGGATSRHDRRDGSDD